MSSCPGAWYVRACGSFHRNEEGKSVSRLLEEDRRHITVMQNLAAKEPALDSPPKKVEKHRLQVESERRMHEKNRRRILQPGFTDAVEYLGVDIAPEQAMAFASTTAGISLLLMLMVYVILIRTQPGLSSILSRYVLPAVFAVPLLLFSFLASYPEMLAKRVRTASIGRTPEPINYITMSLRTSPSLERAVIFAGEHSGEPMASSLKRVVWDVMLRRHASIEDSLADFAYKCGKWNEEMRRALYLIRGAVLEKSPEGFERGLEKAHDVALSGAKEKVEAFASRLSGPATVLFAFGVVMPMLVGSIIPMQGMTIPTGMETVEENAGSTISSTISIIILMDIAFPTAAFLYAYSILGRRPGTIQPPDVRYGSKGSAMPVAMALGAFPLLLYILPPYSPMAPESLGHLPILLSLSLAAGAYLLISTTSAYKERRRLLAMERDLPDALFQLGSRIAEGKPLEKAFDITAKTMEDSPLSPLFHSISNRMAVSRRTLDDVLFAKDGILEDKGSRALQASMRSLIESVKKDPVTAGKTIIQTANYMKDLQKVDHDIRVKLQGVVDMMKVTSMFFAPVVMGVTVALYAILAGQFSLMGSQAMMPPLDFAMVLGVFLFLSSLVSAYFVTGIMWGDDRLALKRNIGSYIPVSMLIFTFSVAGAMLFIS